MSVYQLDIYRLSSMTAKNLLMSGVIEQEPSSITELDGSIILEYETWHGSPEPEFELFLAKEETWLYACQDNDGECFIDDTHAPCYWKNDLVISKDPDGNEYLEWQVADDELTELTMADIALIGVVPDIDDIRDAIANNFKVDISEVMLGDKKRLECRSGKNVVTIGISTYSCYDQKGEKFISSFYDNMAEHSGHSIYISENTVASVVKSLEEYLPKREASQLTLF